jgi:hypothetical protein
MVNTQPPCSLLTGANFECTAIVARFNIQQHSNSTFAKQRPLGVSDILAIYNV